LPQLIFLRPEWGQQSIEYPMRNIKLYKDAFMTALQCNEDEFKMKPYYVNERNQTRIASHKNKTYLVLSYSDLNYKAEELLKTDMAYTIMPEVIEDVFENIWQSTFFYEDLFPEGHKIYKYEGDLEQKFLDCCTQAKKTGNSFWNILHEASMMLYNKVINQASSYNLESSVSELVHIWMLNGEQLLSEHRDGIFEVVELIPNLDRRNVFFVFDVDINFEEEGEL
jgi:hypothetical protein